MKEKEKLYEEMVYTIGSSGSSNSSTGSGNISLPLGNLTLNSSISQTASMTNVDYLDNTSCRGFGLLLTDYDGKTSVIMNDLQKLTDDVFIHTMSR